jgi:hypothetical protein
MQRKTSKANSALVTLFKRRIVFNQNQSTIQMRDQFMRIAMARIRADYPFRLQRIAVAAKMWSRYVERKQL